MNPRMLEDFLESGYRHFCQTGVAFSCAANSKIGIDSTSRNTRSVDRVAASAIVGGLTKLACEFYENRRRNVLQEALER